MWYIRTFDKPERFEVGHYKPDGTWTKVLTYHVNSMLTEQEAFSSSVALCARLNGGK